MVHTMFSWVSLISLGPVLLTWVHFNPTMDMKSHVQLSLGWNYLSMPKHPWYHSKFAPHLMMVVLSMRGFKLIHKNIVRQTAHTIVSWPNPKQWLTIHTSDLMKYTFSQSWQANRVSWRHTAPYIEWKIIARIVSILDTHSAAYIMLACYLIIMLQGTQATIYKVGTMICEYLYISLLCKVVRG